MHANSQNQSGFTLVEIIIVMVITGIIGAMVAMFLTAPVKQYTDVARRAEMTDIADTAFQRVLRDIRTAVPNSVRLYGGATSGTYIEFLPTKVGGRYRLKDVGGNLCTGVAGNTSGDALSFTATDTCFEFWGTSVAATAATGDYLVVGNTQSGGANAYIQTTAASVLRTITAVGAKTISITSVNPFPAAAQLGSQRFQVVDGQVVAGKSQGAVTYACVVPGGGACTTDPNGNGTCQLIRYSGYGIVSAQLTQAQLALLPTSPILANNISGCNFVYDVTNQRDGLVALTLQITQGGETVNLYEEVHVNNAP